MKTRFKHRVVAMTLALMMTASPVWGVVHATDEGIGDQPEKPVAESYMDNKKIEEYNKQVDDYNESAKAYNESVDKEYEAAVAETDEKNAEIDRHNEAELERVKAAEEKNAQAVKDAEEANTKISSRRTPFSRTLWVRICPSMRSMVPPDRSILFSTCSDAITGSRSSAPDKRGTQSVKR